MSEIRIPEHWYVIVSGWLDPYLTIFATMEDPSLERLETEGPQLAKLGSSSFSNLADYEEVLNDARDLVQLMMGAMGINQDPGPLQIVNVIGVYGDGSTEKYPPHGRRTGTSIRLGIPTTTGWVEGATPRATFEQSVVLFARRSGNTLVTDVLRFLALSPDWFGLYKALEIVRFDLNNAEGKKSGNKFIVANGWATNDEMNAFHTTAEWHRHWKRKAPPTPMDIIDARQLVGRIITQWIITISRRSRPKPPTRNNSSDGHRATPMRPARRLSERSALGGSVVEGRLTEPEARAPK
jgi:hypothetical protein